MARFLLAFALIASLSARVALAQPAPPSSPSPEPSAAPEGKRGKKDRDKDGDFDRRPPLPPLDQESPLGRFKKRLEQMSPEERKHFQDNWKRWKEMNDGERRDWQKRAVEERDKLKKNVDEAIAKLGLRLDDDQREVFALRYHQERRKLEQSLCEEMQKKRDAGIDGILQKLKAEFSAPKASPSPAPGATPQ